MSKTIKYGKYFRLSKQDSGAYAAGVSHCEPLSKQNMEKYLKKLIREVERALSDLMAGKLDEKKT